MQPSGMLIPTLITLQTELGMVETVNSSTCIDEFVDANYPQLKDIVRSEVLDEHGLVIPVVERIESLGMRVSLDKETQQLTIYLNNGHFKVQQ